MLVCRAGGHDADVASVCELHYLERYNFNVVPLRELDQMVNFGCCVGM